MRPMLSRGKVDEASGGDPVNSPTVNKIRRHWRLQAASNDSNSEQLHANVHHAVLTSRGYRKAFITVQYTLAPLPHN